MSRRISINGDDDDGDDDDNNNRKKRKRSLFLDGCNSYKKGLKRAKRAVLSPFNKFQKLFKRGTNRCSSTASEGNNNGIVPNSSSLQSDSIGVGSYFCSLCMSKEPETVDISSDDVDPNDPRISYVYVRTLLEQNEFYSKECNTHFVD